MNNYERLKEVVSRGQVDPGRLASAAKRRLINFPHATAWRTQGLPVQNRISALRNTYAGQRCFIMGNGPSLKTMDLSPLANEKTFGLNRINLMFDELGFATTFHVAVNELVLEQCADEIASSPSLKFLSWNRRHLFPKQDDILFLHQNYKPHFAQDITQPVWGGATVTYVSMQIAYYLGFQEVVLIGVDHSFKAKGTPHKTVVSQGADADHFDPRYFGKGFRWQLPDLTTSEIAYTMARHAFEADGRKIVDATVGGKLDVFEKVDYYQLFDRQAVA